MNDEEFNFSSILDTNDLYVFFYKLKIIEYLITSEESDSCSTQVEKEWVNRFICCDGYQKIIEIFFKFVSIYQE
jgi:hypothetical protein